MISDESGIKLFDRKFVASNLKLLLRCPKCSAEYSDKYLNPINNRDGHRPFVLPCGHSMCESCITRDRLNLKCAVCLELSPPNIACKDPKTKYNYKVRDFYELNYHVIGKIVDLKFFRRYTNDSVNSTLQYTSMSDMVMQVKCSECGYTQNMGECKQCNAYYCKSCFDSVHRHSRVLKTHGYRRLEEKNANRKIHVGKDSFRIPAGEICNSHNLTKNIYCHQCRRTNCERCYKKYHHDHKVVYLSELNMRFIDEIPSTIEAIDAAMLDIKNSQQISCNGIEMSKFGNAGRQLTTRSSDINALAQRGYNIGHKIGEGSYATVITAGYADNSGNNVHLACKIIDKAKAPTDFVHRFFPRELDILTKIDHPNIIQIHSILQRGPKIFIFMRYAENGDLLSHIKKSGPIEEKQAKAWFLQMAKGLKYLHTHEIAHRDLKCENILLSKRLNIKLADFGFARYCCDETGRELKSETYCGSAAYAAPEVVCGRPYDPKLADAWSLGVILFIMMNAKMPFDDSNLTKLLEDQRNKKFAFRRKLQDSISAQAKATVSVLLEPDASSRWDLREILNCHWLRGDAVDVNHLGG